MDKVKAYRNLHRKCWSLKRGKEPVSHADEVILKNCEFTVRQGGRNKVLRERQKNAHAFVSGEVITSTTGQSDNLIQVSYDPYRNPEEPGAFYRKDTGENVFGATALLLKADGTVFAENPRSSP